MSSLHPNESAKAPQQLAFIDPGAGTGVHALQKWLIDLYEKMSKGKTRAVVNLLKEKGLPPGVPLTTSVLSSGEGVEACFALPLVCLMTSRTPDKVLKTLIALEKKGYVWKSICTLEKRPVPWETACALAWITLEQRLEATTLRPLPVAHILNKRLRELTGEEIPLPSSSERVSHARTHAFVQWQGGDPALLAQPEQINAFVALAVHALSPLTPHPIGLFLQKSPPALIKEAWTTPWQTGFLSPAHVLAHRLWACFSLGKRPAVIHRNTAGTLTVPSPSTLMRCWRTAWDTPPLSPEAVHATLASVTGLRGRYGEERYPVAHSLSLSDYQRYSSIAEAWCAQPGGLYALRALNHLEPLPATPLSPGTLISEWHLETRQVKEVRRQFSHHQQTRRKLMRVPQSALKGGWRAARPDLFSPISSGNKIVMFSPYEPRHAAHPKNAHDDREEGGTSSVFPQAPSQEKSVPTAADVLLCWNRWMEAPHATSPDLPVLVNLLHAFEKQEGAPFTFKLGKDEHRWSIHGYLWGRGTSRGEEVSHCLSRAGYPPCAYGYSVHHTDAQGQEDIRVEPFEVCVLQRFDTLIALQSPSKDTTAGVSPALRQKLDLCNTRLVEAGYVLDFQSLDSAGRPLYHTAVDTMRLHNVFPFYTWMMEHGVQLQGAAAMLETIQARLTVKDESDRYWLWANEKESMHSITLLINHLERHLLQATLPAAEKRDPSRVSARPRI